MSFTYKLYTGDPVALSDVATIESETFESEGTDVIKLSTTQPKDPETEYFANILAIHDESGEKAIYEVISVITAAEPSGEGSYSDAYSDAYA